ncbi:hypothetical protein L7F22_060100 [Adiantum nelumboides]|nr:hypothetical protein [Adiantum nelumboides]
MVCQKMKYDRHKAPALLLPLSIPDRPLESIAMDFIFDLPRTQSGHGGIWTIVDRFSKQTHFVPVKKTIKADHMAKLFIAQFFRYHGMPYSIVSNRDPKMTSLFWRALCENLGTTLKFSSLFHPHTDGQSELGYYSQVFFFVSSTDTRAVRDHKFSSLDLLKCYVSDHKSLWDRYLPLVEFAYNNTVHTSIGKAPFEIVEGHHSRLLSGKKVPPILCIEDKIFEADHFIEDLASSFAKIKKALQKSQERHKKVADKHRQRQMDLKEGDWVLLKFEKAQLRKKKEKE